MKRAAQSQQLALNIAAVVWLGHSECDSVFELCWAQTLLIDSSPQVLLKTSCSSQSYPLSIAE